MRTRKWSNSGVPITSISSLMDCMQLYGGALWGCRDRFMNSSWIESQQFHTLLTFIAKRTFYFPKLNNKGTAR